MSRQGCLPASEPRTRWKLLACDLDGTLVGRHNQINRADVDALRAAVAAGLQVAICTGRNYGESRSILADLGLSGPGVFVNGATICEVPTGRYLHRSQLSPEQIRTIMELLGARGHSVLALATTGENGDCRYLFTDHGPPHAAAIAWLTFTRMPSEPWPGFHSKAVADVVRLGVIADAGQGAGLKAAILSTFGNTVECHNLESPGYNCDVVEVFDQGVSKWSGLLKLCPQLGISPDEIVAVGDDNNDISMLRGARLSFAMGTANPDTKASARHLTASQRECGVARVVEGLLDGRW